MTVVVLVGGDTYRDERDASNGVANDVWLYEVERDTWHAIQTADRHDARGGTWYGMRHFEPRSGFSLEAFDLSTDTPKAALFGGYGVTHAFLNDLWAISLHEKTLKQLFPAAPLPAVRQQHAAAASHCHMFVYGGLSTYFPSQLNNSVRPPARPHAPPDATPEAAGRAITSAGCAPHVSSSRRGGRARPANCWASDSTMRPHRSAGATVCAPPSAAATTRAGAPASDRRGVAPPSRCEPTWPSTHSVAVSPG